jgi:hypothetical protein
LKNIFFLYISVFIATKNDGQRKSFFSLTVKTYLIIRKWFMIFLNCFLDLNSSFLQVCLWESATAKHWSLLLTQIYRWRSPNFDICLLNSSVDDCHQNLALVCQNLMTFGIVARFQRPYFDKTGRNLTITAGFQPI